MAYFPAQGKAFFGGLHTIVSLRETGVLKSTILSSSKTVSVDLVGLGRGGGGAGPSGRWAKKMTNQSVWIYHGDGRHLGGTAPTQYVRLPYMSRDAY